MIQCNDQVEKDVQGRAQFSGLESLGVMRTFMWWIEIQVQNLISYLRNLGKKDVPDSMRFNLLQITTEGLARDVYFKNTNVQMAGL